MKLNKYCAIIFFLLARLSVYADIALQKPEKLQDAKYYFANVDSFSTYNFFVKKSSISKTYRIKQDAAFLIRPNGSSGNEKLEVWAVNKSDGQKSNSFILTTVKPAEVYGGDIAYIAITFSFDKNHKLNYKQTIMKPDCYSRKEVLPFISVKNMDHHNTLLLLVSAAATFFLLSLFFSNTLKHKNANI